MVPIVPELGSGNVQHVKKVNQGFKFLWSVTERNGTERNSLLHSTFTARFLSAQFICVIQR
jgi:hypothetical protein